MTEPVAILALFAGDKWLARSPVAVFGAFRYAVGGRRVVWLVPVMCFFSVLFGVREGGVAG